MILLADRIIQNKDDMDFIETIITTQLKCENNRCAFFRTRSYIQLRVSALYRSNPSAISLYYDRLCIRLPCIETGKQVCVYLTDEVLVFNNDKHKGEPNQCFIDDTDEQEDIGYLKIKNKKMRINQ